MDVVQASIPEIVEHLNGKAQEKLPPEWRVRIHYVEPKAPSHPRMTFRFTAVSLLDLLKVCACLWGLEMSATNEEILLHAPGERPRESLSARPIALEWSGETIAALTGLLQANAERNGILTAGAALGLFPTSPPRGDPAFAPLQKEIDRCEERRSEFNRLLQGFLSHSSRKRE